MADATAGNGSLQQQGHGVKDLPARGRAECYGFVDSVTHQPPSPQPFFSALVVDHVQAGSPAAGGARKPNPRLRVIWLGRDRVPGIKAGVEVHLKGMVTEVEGLPAMFNPRYEILSTQEH
ncbi:hypothetical protein SB659_07475 [Arthrobacter sp. SIMBA_036]|uniref:hypothetical protein n=1 Tax=Arthrobacter sp. SIMBA_036 TaxID=3085778 RepID=UPI00397C7484